jgi:hypothetical protein
MGGKVRENAKDGVSFCASAMFGRAVITYSVPAFVVLTYVYDIHTPDEAVRKEAGNSRRGTSKARHGYLFSAISSAL